MINRHLFLKNNKSQNNSFKRTRNVQIRPDDIEETISSKTIKPLQINNLRSNYNSFNELRENRYSNRTIEFPKYIDLIEVYFFPIFNSDLKKKFFQKYGLLPVSYSGFNKTVVFEVVNFDLFEIFKQHIELIISYKEAIAYSGQEYNLIANIMKFNFIDKRTFTYQEDNIILSIINVSNSIAKLQKEALITYLNDNEINYSVNHNEDIFYLDKISSDDIKIIERNFDIVKIITSSRANTVRPGKLGNLRMEYGFEVNIPDNLPIVGVIDTGVNIIRPFEDLVLDNGINITGEVDSDYSGHGILVAGLVIFGTDLPASVKGVYNAKSKVLPIKVLHHGADGINFPKLLNSIKLANKEFGVRIFNMSLVFGQTKNYNETFSDFAFELDRLSYENDLLIFISVGNFDDSSLKELLTTDYHKEHNYPEFFYSLNSKSPVHCCSNTNICVPSESLNNISVGALAGNIEEGDNSDITPLNIYPAYYTRKFHYDYDQEINQTEFRRNQKNKYLNKPDLVFDGGDLLNNNSGIEVLTDSSNFYKRTSGTSLASPLVASLAAEVEHAYPSLKTQTIKALLINSATFIKYSNLPHFKNNEILLRKLTGFGVPNRDILIGSENNSITLIVEDEINTSEILSIPIYLPEYLKKSANKLIFNITLAYSFFPDKGNHLSYVPLQIAFNIVKDLPLDTIANGKSNDYSIKSGFSWSEDHFGKENRSFSNIQDKEYKLQPNDIDKLNGSLALAIRCLSKDDIDEGLSDLLKKNSHAFSLVLTITEEIKNETENSLYSEMLEINTLDIISDNLLESDLNIEN
ncbi:S8 family peptidase [Aquimarina agarilytica]|uniref:S8 family peptidase n=1 Tax=Aquimarina agarilytica TaxID=1087449 RepID=UPI000287A64E|nr:S8 family peptidase [Aquimarina agarilytica]